jgi:hypothetical protein
MIGLVSKKILTEFWFLWGASVRGAAYLVPPR